MKQVFFAILMLCATVVMGSEPDSITREWVMNHYTKREVMIPMRDGVKLFTAIYEPISKTEKHPILMNRTCYGCAPYGTDQFIRLWSLGYKEYVRNGYIIVFQDVRGKNMSEGEFEDIRPFLPNKKKQETDEASDVYDTADWLARNTHNNYNIGVHGISYPGFYATLAGMSGHPAVKAVSPQAPVTDWYRGDDDHHNGAFCLMDMYSFEYWFTYINCPDFYAGKISRNDNPTEIVRRDVYTDYLAMGPIKNFTKMTGDSLPMWNATVAHPNLDEYWQTHTITNYMEHFPRTKKAHPAVLVVGGLFDAEDCFGAFATYKALREKAPETEAYLVEGPWSHGAWRYDGAEQLGEKNYGPLASGEYYMHNIEYPFFAYYLEGKGEKPAYSAKMFVTGFNIWIDIPEGWNPADKQFLVAGETVTGSDSRVDKPKAWNPDDEQYLVDGKTYTRSETSFFLGANGKLCSDITYCPKNEAGTIPADAVNSTRYVSDPSRPVPYIGDAPHYNRITSYMNADQRFASWRPDVAVFQTAELERALVIVGTPIVDFYVTLSTTDADFIVKIIDVEPSGRQSLIRWEIMRGKYRDSPSEPAPFTPGKPTRLHFPLNDMTHTFMPGHRLMIQVQSSMFPLFDRNPQRFCDIYQADEQDFQTSEINILHSGEYPSRIVLPVLEMP